MPNGQVHPRRRGAPRIIDAGALDRRDARAVGPRRGRATRVRRRRHTRTADRLLFHWIDLLGLEWVESRARRGASDRATKYGDANRPTPARACLCTDATVITSPSRGVATVAAVVGLQLGSTIELQT